MMTTFAWPLSFRAFGFTVGLIVVTRGNLVAQTSAPASSPAAIPAVEDSTQPELRKSVQEVRDQLRATQLALALNQLDIDSKTRANAAAISTQLDAIKSALLADRERQQLEAQRAEGERERLRIESERSNQRMVYIASVFGCVGLLAMILLPVFQWRAVNRIVEADARRGLLPPSAPTTALLPGEEVDLHAVAQSNQRLISVIDRIGRRVLELEHTATQTAPVATAQLAAGNARLSTEARSESSLNPERSKRIALLLTQGLSLLNTERPAEALALYDEVLALDPRHAEALLKKGVALERLKRDVEAIASYDRAIAIDRKMALAYLHKGGVCHRLARHDEALACYEQALQVEEAG